MADKDFLLPGLRNGPVPHDKRCCQLAFPHTDAAKRVSDTVNLHYAVLGFDSGKFWIAPRLVDGTGGMDLYPTKQEAADHQPNPYLCMYIRLTGAPMNPCEAEILLKTARQLYDNGFPSTERDLIPRIALEHKYATIKKLGG